MNKVTNADKIRNMSDEELAVFLTKFKNTFGEEYEGEQSCLDWLKEDAVTSNIHIQEVQPPKNVIPPASEANKMANHVIDSGITQQLAELSKLIRDAIADGKFSISEDGCLKHEIRKKLEELGYKVETGSQYNESYYSISWR